MAQTVNFYSVSALPAQSVDGNGIYFSKGNNYNTGKIYKGNERYGGAIVTADAAGPSYTDGARAGDVNIAPTGRVTMMDSTGTWQEIGRKWDGTQGTSAKIATIVTPLSTGNNTSYIQYIDRNATTGVVTAHAANFATGVKEAIGNGGVSGANNGIGVSVATTSGKVTSVTVYNPFKATESYAASTANLGVSVSVVTKNGQVTKVSAYGPNYVTAVRAAPLANDDALPTEGAVRAAIDEKFAGLDNAMHFIGVVTALPQSANEGDIVVVGAVGSSSDLVEGQEYVYCATSPSASTYGWELIGDQQTYATKAAVESALDTKASVGNSYFDLLGLSVSMNLTNDSTKVYLKNTGIVTTAAGVTNNAAGNKLVTASAVRAYCDSLDANVTSTIYGTVKMSVKQTDGKVANVSMVGFGAAVSYGVNVDSTKFTTADISNNLVTGSAVAAYVTAKVGDGLNGLDSYPSTTSKGLKIGVQQTDGKLTSVLVDTTNIVTASTNMANNADNDKLVTASAVAAYTIGKITASINALDAGVSSAMAGVGVSVKEADGKLTGISLYGFGDAATRGVVTASTDFGTANLSNSLPTASAVKAYVDAKVTNLAGGLDADVFHKNLGLSLSVKEVDGKLTAVSVTDLSLAKTSAAFTQGSTNLVTAGGVYSYIWNQALVWKDATGAVIS